MPIKFQTATIITKEAIAEKFFLLTCEVSTPLVFTPGQYIVVRVTPERVVQYSLASQPNQSTFEIVVQYFPGGQASEWVKNRLQVGDTIEFYGPLGIFNFHPQDGSTEALFLATGAGIAPFKSIIDHLLINQQHPQTLKLYFGLRHQTHLVYHEHFLQLAKQHPQFTYRPALSQPDSSWNGFNGYITKILADDYSAPTTSLSAYLCGSNDMIADATQILTTLGTPPERIYTEKFW